MLKWCAIFLLFVTSQCFGVTASFTADSVSGCAPLTVNFTNTSVGATSYFWDFGDQLSSTVQDPSHTFYSIGNYDVWLYAYDSVLNVDSTFVTITVGGDLPYFNLPIEACPGEIVPFQMFGSNDPSSVVSWDFGDGAGANFTPTAQHSYGAIGSYSAIMTVTNNSCGTVTDTNTINITSSLIPEVHVHSYGTGTIICPGENFPFFYDETLSIQWDFGDGNSSTDPYPIYTYSAGGNYNVSITVTNACGNTSTLDTVVSVFGTPVPTASIFANALEACPGQTVTYWGNNGFGYTYDWSFDDGTTAVGQYVDHSFSTPGMHWIGLTVTNACGNSAGVSYGINISDTLTPSSSMQIFGDPTCTTDSIYFLATQGLDSYLWDFGDGITSTAWNDFHAYTNYGSYPVALTVTNTCGNSTTYYDTVQVDSTLVPQVAILSGQLGACPGDLVQFSAAPNNLDAFYWDFGDGNTSTSAAPSHAYGAVGSYQVSLIGTNSCGNSDTAYYQILIDSIGFPLVDFATWPGVFGCPNTNFTFENLSSDTANVLWDFGDGTTSIQVSPSHQFAQPGNYFVQLFVTNSCGNQGVISQLVQVSAINLPGADISVDDESLFCLGDTVFVQNIAQGADSVFWDFDSGMTSTDENPYILYSSPVSYNISLQTYNHCGTNGDTITVHIVEQLDAPLISNCGFFDPDYVIEWGAVLLSNGYLFSADGGVTWDTLGSSTLVHQFQGGSSEVEIMLLSIGTISCQTSDTTFHTCYADGIESILGNTIPLEIYPNPATDEVQLVMPNSVQEFELVIYNAIGEVVQRQQVNASNGNTLAISCEKWPAQVYYVTLTNAQSLYSAKLMKQ